jgi:hypothetical protein
MKQDTVSDFMSVKFNAADLEEIFSARGLLFDRSEKPINKQACLWELRRSVFHHAALGGSVVA